jgi:hypothetical protein
MNPSLSRFIIGLSLVVLVCGTVAAAPPPLPEQELVRGSDLIVEVEVMSVAKVGRSDAPFWEAQLRIIKTFKGTAPSNPLRYGFVPPGKEIGARNESVYAGEHLKMYLYRDRSGNYVAWAQNSNQRLENFPVERQVLPSTFGEAIFADGRRSVPGPVCRCD